MIKKIIIPLFLLSIGLIVYLMVAETIVRTKYGQVEIERVNNSPFQTNALSRLTPEELNNLTIKYAFELTQLASLKSYTIALISLCGIWLMAIFAFKPDFSLKKFDGLTLMVTYILLLGTLLSIFQIFTGGKFEYGHNATISIRIFTEIFLLVITPLIFYATYKLNKLEITHKMHAVKWIGSLAIVVVLITSLIALLLGIAILLTPDVSSFKN